MRLDTELVYFDRDAGATGSRFDIYPRIEWNIGTNWGLYATPASAIVTQLMSSTGTVSRAIRHPDRGTEIISFDSGLFMEKYRDNGMVQTLEPRLFYLYVPYVNQDEFPDFDSAPLYLWLQSAVSLQTVLPALTANQMLTS